MLEVVKLSHKAGDFVLDVHRMVINRGSYNVLLGPSGAGKTMLLELMAGYERCQSGHIILDGLDITHLPPSKRGLGMVFQKLWLFPHLTVAQNIAYGLIARKLNSNDIRHEVQGLAQLTHCQHLLNRKADKLSGGEAQRVAIARTLALAPKVLLLDEPLTNLDGALKLEISSLLRQLHRQGQTIIHVTHDHHEAMSLATDVTVIHQGKLLQQGSKEEVFTRPRNAFVAQFAGIRNFYTGTLSPPSNMQNDLYTFSTGNVRFLLPKPDADSTSGFASIDARAITISPEMLNSSAVNQFCGIIADLLDLADGIEVVVDVKGVLFRAIVTKNSAQRLNLQVGNEVYLQFKGSSVCFEPE